MLSSSVLDRFRLTQIERDLGVYGVHVYQEGEGEVAHRFRADDPVHVWSASKTFTSLAVGMCVDEGRLKLGDEALAFFPECVSTAAPDSEDITVKNLLQMCSGKDFSIFEETSEDVMAVTDWAQLYFAGRQVTAPGEHFFYCNGNSYMLSRIVEKVSGSVLRDYLMPRLFGPLHILNPDWNMCPGRHSTGGWGLHITTSQLAKLGRLLLQDGVWDGKRLVSSDYVKAMHEDVVDPQRHFQDEESNAGYGYQLWLNTVPGTYRADGMYGQFSIVVPDKRAVITTTSHNERNANDIVRAVFSDIVPQL